MTEAIATADELFALLESCSGFFDSVGADGDPIDVLDHGLQCAALLALEHPDDAELQVAGLVHDVGHRLWPGASAAHGRIAASAVRELLGDRVAALIELHVPAKRYLVTVDPSYRHELSDGSAISLGRQGGALTAPELAELEADVHLGDAVALRRCDDRAKVVGAEADGLARWRPLVERVVATR
ncbi:MAG TPA: HD domain-containing protein [Acidimicrobiales bacterium]|jgi:predicted HD phosphohydrolase|nr:HD domain-containing protein [Acidimicrobiales bacterium]